jgi:hypothetical protein
VRGPSTDLRADLVREVSTKRNFRTAETVSSRFGRGGLRSAGVRRRVSLARWGPRGYPVSTMRWVERHRRRRADKKQRRDEKRKQSLRPRIAEAGRAVVPATERVLIQAIGAVSFLPPAPAASPSSMRSRLSTVLHSLGRPYGSYIIATDEHLILLPQRSEGRADLTVPLASISGAWCRHNKFVYVPTGYSSVSIPEHVEIWMYIPGDAERRRLTLKVSRPWLSEAAELCTAFGALKEPSDFWERAGG